MSSHLVSIRYILRRGTLFWGGSSWGPQRSADVFSLGAVAPVDENAPGVARAYLLQNDQFLFDDGTRWVRPVECARQYDLAAARERQKALQEA